MGYIQPSSPLKIKNAAYEKQNKKMRKENMEVQDDLCMENWM